MKYKYILGLDIGISSVGWGIIALNENDNPYKIIDVGCRIFSPGEVDKTGDSRAKERREKRGSRRVIRRREFRLDRVRNLLFEKGFLKGEVCNNLISDKNEELTIIYNNMIQNYYKKNHTNPYELKVQALDRTLLPEELSIILVHYAKKRGYKSNREEENDKESGKVLSAIKANEKIMQDKKYRSVSEMFVLDEKFSKKIKNSPNNYNVSITNEMYLDEINKVLDKQIFFGVIDKDFKEEYLKIYNSRRHYSEGPGYYYVKDEAGEIIKKRSKYGGNLIEKMTGICEFDKQPRAPKMAPSSEIFVALTRLVNLKYKDSSGNLSTLNSEEIKKIINIGLEKKSGVTYSDVAKVVNKEEVSFNKLSLSKKEYGKLIDDLKKMLNIDKKADLDVKILGEEEKKLHNELYIKKLNSKTLFELQGYHKLKNSIVKAYSNDIWNSVKNNMDFLDELALYCTNYKINDDILEKIKASDGIDNLFADINFVNLLPNFKDHLMLSTNIIKKITPLMMQGMTYDKAMSLQNFVHFNPNIDKDKNDTLVPITKDNNITNQRVIRSLTQTRKVINAVIKKYGMPQQINIETARELAKTRKERNIIEKNNLENKEINDNIKLELMDKCGNIFQDINDISSNDLLKYKLWQEQNELCGYSMKHIELDDLFVNNTVQIDHILPYSRTFNDNYLNKTLVFTKENQDKRDKIPYEWFGSNEDKWNRYESFINSLYISPKKKDNYLLKELSPELAREMREQNLNDTKYISRELASFIKAYLNVDKVKMYPGAITGKLRARWGFNRLTHSYRADDFYLPTYEKKDIKKDRDNHLHHAMDALVIASINKNLENNITKYEKFSRYVDGVTSKKLMDIEKGIIDNDTGQFYDAETGEVIYDDLRNYIMQQENEKNISRNKHDITKLKFPMPYKNFDIEAKARVYEQDLQSLKNIIVNNIGTYNEKEINSLHTLTPSIAKNKVSGKMHGETYYGTKSVKVNNDSDINRKVLKTLRTPIEKVKRSDLDNIPDKDSGSKDIYNSLVNWFDSHKDEFISKDFNKITGEDILKVNGNVYPVNINDKEHKEIKKLKVYSEYNNTGHIVNGSIVEKGNIYRIEVFKSKDSSDEKLYFVGYDIYEIENIKKIENSKAMGDKFIVKLGYGQSNNYKMISYNDLQEHYVPYITLGKNDLVKIVNKKDNVCIAYIVGYSEGRLEVKSKIGDGYDLIKTKINENTIFSDLNGRYFITVSTIKEIRKLSINILGEISGL